VILRNHTTGKDNIMKKYISVVIICFLVFGACSANPPVKQPSKSTDNISDDLKVYELSKIWSEAKYNYAFWDRHDIFQLDDAYKVALEKVQQTNNLYEYYLELQKFISFLQSGHTGIVFPDTLDNNPEYLGAGLPIRLRYIDQQYVIDKIDINAVDKVKLGSVIKKVNGTPIDDFIEENIYPYELHQRKDCLETKVNNRLRYGKVGSQVEFELEHNGKIEIISLTRTMDSKNWVKDGSLLHPPESINRVYESQSHTIDFTEDNLAIITIDSFRNPGLYDDLLSNFSLLQKASGYIIDVRKNGGGLYQVTNIAGLFLNEKYTYRELQRIHEVYYWITQFRFLEDPTEEQIANFTGWMEKFYKVKRGRYYMERTKEMDFGGERLPTTFIFGGNTPENPGFISAPLVVLTSPLCASATEVLLMIFDALGRATLVGTPSMGAMGQPYSFALESGGRVSLCANRMTYPDGKEVENVGIQPHVYHNLTLDDYKNGIDSTMAKGIEVLREKL
jgi:C-terminal processing protease CtpA/Prc